MKKFRFTLIGLFTSVILWLLIKSLELDLFEGISSLFRKLEIHEIDEIIFPVIVLLIFSHIDILKKHRKAKIESEKNNIYKAMLEANNHIINNFLNEMQIFKLTAEETSGFPKDILDLYDSIIRNSKTKIECLGDLKKLDAESISKAIQKSLYYRQTCVN